MATETLLASAHTRDSMQHEFGGQNHYSGRTGRRS